ASEAAQWRSKAARMFRSSFIVFSHVAVQGCYYTENGHAGHEWNSRRSGVDYGSACLPIPDIDVPLARGPAVRVTGVMWAEARPYSALMLAARITLPHFSVSAAMCLPKSAGEPESAATPNSVSRAFILRSARAALVSLLSLSTISAGVFFGAPMPVQKLAS